jgi:iron complex transport system permease protein
VFQAVFRNPMADPYVLGISSGAAFGVSLAAFLGLIGGAVGAWQVPLAAGIGALGAALFVFTVSAGMRRSVTTLLLTGIALNFFLSAAMTLFMYLNRNQLQSVIQWSLGSFSSASWLKLRLLALIAIPPVLIIACFTREMDVLLLDEGSALSVGLPLRSMRLTLLALSSIATAAVVSLYGIVGFVGLMVPHVVRLVVGPRHRLVLPCALLGGALMMVASDTISRTVIGASELPVGVVTSIAGAPLFIVMLANYRKGGGLR